MLAVDHVPVILASRHKITMFIHRLQAIEVTSDWISCKLGVLITILLGFEIYKFCFLIFSMQAPFYSLGVINILIRVQVWRIYFIFNTYHNL